MRRLPFALLLASILAPPAALAAPTDPDPTFGVGGVALTDAFAGSDVAFDGIVLPGGKILICGSGGGQSSFMLARYRTNGVLDSTFGTQGFRAIAFGGSSMEATCIARQPDGKIVVGGDYFSSPNHFTAVARFDTAGTLDPTFGVNGKVSQVVGTTGSVQSIAVQPDGKIIIAGTFLVTGTIPFVGMRRYGATGVLDSTFGFNGTVTRGPGVDNACYAIALQPDGKIVAVGSTKLTAGSTDEFLTFRFKSNGTPDSTFGTVGRVVTSVSVFRDFAKDVSILADGRILVAGHTGVAADNSDTYAVLRFLPNGVLDSNFGVGGIAVTPVVGITNGYAFLNDLLVLHSGRMLLTGQCTQLGSSDDFAICRMDSTGTMDSSWGTGGIFTTDISGGGRDTPFRLLQQGDGKLVAVGDAGVSLFVNGGQIALLRLMGDEVPVGSVATPAARAGVDLAPSRPNPFRGETQLSFTLPRAEHVVLRVYDLAGREVATLANGEMTAGTHHAAWNGEREDGADAGSGLYFCRLEATADDGTRDASVVRKITLVR